jgi:hypothetical protein
MTGLGWPLDLWIIFTILYVSMFALIVRYLNARETRFKREHPDEDLY